MCPPLQKSADLTSYPDTSDYNMSVDCIIEDASLKMASLKRFKNQHITSINFLILRNSEQTVLTTVIYGQRKESARLEIN